MFCIFFLENISSVKKTLASETAVEFVIAPTVVLFHRLTEREQSLIFIAQLDLYEGFGHTGHESTLDKTLL
jgi:hypothetical protein